MSSIFDALHLMMPFDIDKPKIRIGPKGDGGYIFVDDLSPDQTVISYGIGDEWRLDLEFAERGHQVYMFDHTVDHVVDIQHRNMHFFKEGVAAQSDSSKCVFSVDDHLLHHEITGRRLIMKMDVEGAEFDALLSLPSETLARFEQLVIECHDLHLLDDETYRSRFISVFQKINAYATLFHVHANNFDGPDTFSFAGGIPIPRIIELSYVRTASVIRRRSQTLYPTSLDFPNTAQRDKLLWAYPFLPTDIDTADFSVNADRILNGWDHETSGPGSPAQPSILTQLELKEAQIQSLTTAAGALREQLELKEAELQRIASVASALREQLEETEAQLKRNASEGSGQDMRRDINRAAT